MQLPGGFLLTGGFVEAKQTLIEDAAAIARQVTRLAHEIVEKNSGAGEVVLIGIRTRGEPLAERLQSLITGHTDHNIQLGALDITFHRDDFRERLVVPQIKGTHIDFSLDDKIVVLVDDVLYSGRTIRSAMEALMAFGRPKKIQLAVLVDRGHRELPIKADYVGKNIPTNEGEHVNVMLKEVDGKDAIVLMSYKEES
ncbi:MAG: bifunctional pyr operon transcriptional regulator/uracil phosphoribosyltransferase [Candidatus Marinimicrobia bacterium]|jgi:pyrimidine operon attenuation protein/uracil phosphoribosyltransferase|nr:bifunctional pyr operon transcriptional regulator/uracil phosphoribosyltransferase [Candidatus Neomarinimicrobiota bacterium]|tara:strand:+ start:1391 stop:1981 length:591 start_codon:yes stop_codon:yes gene_type:complete